MSRTLATVGNESNPNKLANFFRGVGGGTALKLVAQTFEGTVTSNVLTLPDGLRCAVVLSAFATAGTGPGAKTPITGASPAAGQVGIDQLGRIVFNGTDAVTSAVVVFVAAEGDTISVIAQTNGSGLAAIPSGGKARLLLAATVAGASRTVIARGAAPSAGQAALTNAGTGVQFNAADANLSCTLTYLELPKVTETVIGKLLSLVDF